MSSDAHDVWYDFYDLSTSHLFPTFATFAPWARSTSTSSWHLTWHGAAEGRRQRGRRRRQGMAERRGLRRGRGADRAAAAAAGAAALGAALRGLLWRQPRVAREGSNRETEKKEKKRNPKKDRRKKHWKLNGFRGKRRKPCCFLIKPHRIILRVVWLHFSQYHEVFHDLSTIDANTSNDDFSVEKHRSNMFNQHPCFICFTHASVCLSMPPIFQKVSQSAEIESLEVETVKTRKWTTAYLSTL